ncbi:MAG TPA: acyltransferase [Tepidisphaeraceae bacterium]|nr:acyltransferase [Tepidisphaeraceae bacterium]
MLDHSAAHQQYLRAKYFGSLDGLRCLSIIMVIGFHCQLISTNFFRTGQHGVSLFFVISGFLITTLLLREQRNSGTISLPNFYIRRTLRIFALYCAAVLLYTALILSWSTGPSAAHICTTCPTSSPTGITGSSTKMPPSA